MSNARLVHRLAATSYLALITLLLANVLWLAPPPPQLISVMVLILVGPLLVALRGVVHGRRYTIAWSSMLILLYFMHGVMVAAGGGRGAVLGGVEIALALAYFVLAIRYVRLSNPARQADA